MKTLVTAIGVGVSPERVAEGVSITTLVATSVVTIDVIMRGANDEAADVADGANEARDVGDANAISCTYSHTIPIMENEC